MRYAKLMLAAAAASGALALGGCGSTALMRETPTCNDFTISIYFERDSAAVTREGNAIIRSAAQRSRGCTVRGVEVLGLADAVGDPQVNLQLSEHRVEAVTRALHQRGLTSVSFRTGAAGEAGAQTPSGELRPLRRRVDITLRLEARAAAR
jgi:outer membrane protein OmpA-like peptidoglycan-associated protein